LGSTPVTMAVMVPAKSLAFSVLPLPAKVLLTLPAAFWPGPALGLDQRQAVSPPVTAPVLSMVLVDFWLALTFSTICTVSVSPTMRARWSSNSGRYWRPGRSSH
jgi:hypothetical protein